MGSTTFIAVAAAGWLSASALDRHFAAAATDQSPASAGRKETPARKQTPTPSPSSVACVGADGTWKNWVWANVPMLSPKCSGDR
jgi:hypothetical protein